MWLRVLFAFFLSSCLLADDQPAKPGQPTDGQTTLKSHSVLVIVPVVVTDKAGNHVSGLKKEDFTVQENGVEQKISFFDEVTTNTQRIPRPASHDNTFSNTLPEQPSVRRVTIMLLDLLNTKFEDQKRVKDDLVKFLSALDTTEPTALYVLTRNGLKVIHGFSSDPHVLVEAIHKLKGSTAQISDNGSSEGVSDSSDAMEISAESDALQQALDDAAENFASFQRRVSIQITLDAMQQLAKAYTGLPGRKSLVWATGSFPFSVSDTSMGLAPAGRDSLVDVLPFYERTWQAINDANFAVYPIDARGLMAPSQIDASRRGIPGSSGRNRGGFPRAGQSSATWTQTDSLATLSVIASATGGKAYYNSNDLAAGFREAAKDSSAYYLLSYYLDRDAAAKTGWHKLHVKVNHEKNVRARSGFFVTTADPNTQRKLEVVTALNSPLDYTEVPFTLRWIKFDAQKDPGKQIIEYEVLMPRSGTTIDEADHNHLRMEFISIARSAEGKPATTPQMQVVDTHLQPEVFEQLKKTAFRYRDFIELPNGEYTVRFVVRDALSGKMGSVAAALKLADPTNHQ
jgi:VWFA-related protein